MSSMLVRALVLLVSLLVLVVVIIPVSSVFVFLYVLLEPMQVCRVGVSLNEFIFHNLVQLPYRFALTVANFTSDPSTTTTSSSSSPSSPTTNTNSTTQNCPPPTTTTTTTHPTKTSNSA